MKKLLLAFAGIAISAAVHAQADSANKKMSPPDVIHNSEGKNQERDVNKKNNSQKNFPVTQSHPDGAMMQNGTMMLVKNGKTSLLDYDLTMSNGTKVRSNGACIKKDGTRMIMKEGQHINMSGQIIQMETDKNKNMYVVPDSIPKK